MTRRPDAFNDLRQPYMAQGDFMWGGIAVVINPRIQPEHVGDQIRPVWPHWLYTWIVTKLFRRQVWPMCFARGEKITEHHAYMSSAANKLFMSPAMWEAVKKQVPARKS